jgi:hypothetical protein
MGLPLSREPDNTLQRTPQKAETRNQKAEVRNHKHTLKTQNSTLKIQNPKLETQHEIAPMNRFPSWHFRTTDPGEVQVDPVHDEFFKMQDLVDALVRESIQNSLDARRGSSQRRTRSRRSAPVFRRTARAHRGRRSLALLRDPAGRRRVPYLLIEDFGTRGLSP